MSINKTTNLIAAALIFGGVGLGTAHASDEHVGPATEFAKSTVTEWIASPDLIAAIKAQNEKHAGLTQGRYRRPGQAVARGSRWFGQADDRRSPGQRSFQIPG